MPTHMGVEVWIEDSEHRKLNHQGVTINLVEADDRTMTVKIEMSRDELYTVHCRSSISVFCDVFVITAAHVRRSAARFYVGESLAVSENASGSSTDHTTEKFRDHGLRTPKRGFQQGKLGTVEVEIRRIGEIIKEEPREECQADEDEGVDFIMIDEPDQPPWLVFRFDISAKELLLGLASTTEHVRKRTPRKMLVNKSRTMGSSNETSREINHEHCHNPKKRPREHAGHDGSSSADRNPSPIDANLDLDLLQQEYQKEEAEEHRLMRKLQERLQTKRARNTELRRLVGETA